MMTMMMASTMEERGCGRRRRNLRRAAEPPPSAGRRRDFVMRRPLSFGRLALVVTTLLAATHAPSLGSFLEESAPPGSDLRRRLDVAATETDADADADAASVAKVPSKDAYMRRLTTENRLLFQPVPGLRALGPTHIPDPTSLIPSGVAVEEPKLGQHRPEKDAVVAFAAEYTSESFVTFVESLRETGFDGDVVLAVSSIDLNDKGIYEYLSSSEGVVVYSPNRTCYNLEGEAVESAKGGTRVCECPGMFAQLLREGSAEVSGPLPDPRPPRTLATLRYELYWLMIRRYHPHSWILVVDARDTYFQADPFATVPRETDPSGSSGLLYYFGENVDATRIGKSKQNAKWISSSYGDNVGRLIRDKPTICSGATMGEKVAMAAYVSAIVSESDETNVVLTGADQGFHNYLYYSHKLANVREIHDIVVFDQGTGIVNNLGAMRTQPLELWGHGGLLKDVSDAAGNRIGYQVLNWDGTLSPVVHQYDRHKQLTRYFATQRGAQLMEKWNQRRLNATTTTA